jgi:hypothetical protein
VEPIIFPISDEKTTEDRNTLLLVQFQPSGYDGGLTLILVGLAAELMDAKGADELLNTPR